MNVQYLSRLELTPIPRTRPVPHLSEGTDKMMLVDPFMIEVEYKGKRRKIVVPRGYITDGASIPRFFHRIYHPFKTESMWASTIHDYIYSDLHNIYSKEFADELLRVMIEIDQGSWIMRNAFYRAVRLNFNGGGWSN